MGIRRAVLGALLIATTTPSAHAAPTRFEDGFGAGLGPDWSWLREDVDAWFVRDGALHLRNVAGTIWGGAGSPIPFLLRPSPGLVDGVAAEVTVRMDIRRGQAGLVWYWDDDNYVKLVKERVGSDMTVVIAREEGGAAVPLQAPFNPPEVRLRLSVAGGEFVGEFRAPDDTGWTEVGRLPLITRSHAPRVGLFTHSGDGSETYHEFDDFRIQADDGFRALVFTRTEAFRHGSITDGLALVQELGNSRGFSVDTTEDLALFADDPLSFYRTVVFLSTTGDILDPAEEAAFERYIQAGGSWVGVHAAADCEYGWPWYGGLLGNDAWFSNHPSIQGASLDTEDATHPASTHLPPRFDRTDEWYNFQNNPRSAVNVLVTLDESTYTGGDMGADHPISWYHRYDGGRAWYTGMGHTAASYAEPDFRDHIAGGLLWAAGADTGPPAVPTDLAATPASAARIDLTWTDTAFEELGFAIERRPDGGRFSPIVTVGPDVTSWSDSRLERDTSYGYRVASIGRIGRSAWSAEATATTDAVSTPRVAAGVQVLYEFYDGGGAIVTDSAGVGPPIDLTIDDPTAVMWTTGGLVVRSATTIASTDAVRLVDALTANLAYTVEAWLVPEAFDQSGPAPIVGMASGAADRNFGLGQGRSGGPGALYGARLRTLTTPADGASLDAPLGTADTRLTHVVHTRGAGGTARIYVNGRQVTEGAITGLLVGWVRTAPLAIASDPAGSGPGWLGELFLVAVYDRALTPDEVEQNYDVLTCQPVDVAGSNLMAVADGGDARLSWSSLSPPFGTVRYQVSIATAPSDLPGTVVAEPASTDYSDPSPPAALTMYQVSPLVCAEP